MGARGATAAARAAALAAALAFAVVGCGGDPKPISAACTQGADAVLRALARAPGYVRLPDGMRLSDCVTSAYTDGDVQSLGFAVTPAADRLASSRTPRAALELGYLIGAIDRGSRRTNGVHVELVRRLQAAAARLDDPALAAAVARGARAGEARG